MLNRSVMKDELNMAGSSWRRSASPQWARKLSAHKSRLFCLVRPDMPEADDRRSAYKLKRTAIFALLSFLWQAAGGGACFTEVNVRIP